MDSVCIRSRLFITFQLVNIALSIYGFVSDSINAVKYATYSLYASMNAAIYKAEKQVV